MRHVIATAGHVDHGKSTLVRALTGMEPDRFAEERRRGMTIDLGYAWTTLPTGQQLAFVDVPGHQRFIANMLAGLGPAPAVLFVVAADEGWSRQSDEHLAAVNALRVRHGVLAITRSDLADPARALAHARNVLRGSSLGDVEAVAVSGVTGAGLDPLRSALARLADRLPAPDSTAPVRFWIDRSFTIRGSGTVVTGTLSSGLIALGDVLILRDRLVTVRSIQSAGVPVDSVRPVSRVAVNLRAVTTAQIGRGDVLLTPDRFHLTSVVDVQLEAGERMLAEVVLHVGTAAVPARIRPLGRDFARLTMLRPLPLRAGDRTVLRDPGRQSVAAGALVLDADPPDLRRRGAARARADVLTTATVPPDPGVELARRGAVRRHDLDRLGVDTADLPGTGAWLVSAPQRAAWLERMPAVVDDWAREHPLDPPIPRGALRQALAVPDDALLDGVVAQAGLSIVAGRVGPVRAPSSLGPAEAGVTTLLARLAERPFDAPGQDELRDLGLGRREVAAAVRAGRLVQLAEGVVLLPDAPERAAAVLAELDAPFTLSAARQALRTTRRTAVPLLEHLDSLGLTERDSSFTRRVRL